MLFFWFDSDNDLKEIKKKKKKAKICGGKDETLR